MKLYYEETYQDSSKLHICNVISETQTFYSVEEEGLSFEIPKALVGIDYFLSENDYKLWSIPHQIQCPNREYWYHNTPILNFPLSSDMCLVLWLTNEDKLPIYNGYTNNPINAIILMLRQFSLRPQDGNISQNDWFDFIIQKLSKEKLCILEDERGIEFILELIAKQDNDNYIINFDTDKHFQRVIELWNYPQDKEGYWYRIKNYDFFVEKNKNIKDRMLELGLKSAKF